MSTVVGVDGCKIGWFYFRRDQTSITYDVALNLADLVSSLPSRSRVFIDIPIGLLDDGDGARDCDTMARKALGSPRASSVFSAPARPVLSAENYEDAKRRSFDAIGKMISQQAFAITPKIREVNNYLALNLQADHLIREIHPELCFWGLNQRQPMRYPKKKPQGFEERLQVLEKYLPDINRIIEDPLASYTRSAVAKDDVLDALVALVVASTSADKLKTMPTKPKIDSKGLPMEIVYTEEANTRAI